MKRTATLGQVSIFCVATVSAAIAGPDETANRFLNDNPSMMDWGMYRLQDRLSHGDFGNPSVSYNWDRNRIEIVRDEFFFEALPEDVEEACRMWVKTIRDAGGVASDGKLFYPDSKTSYFADMFQHNGFLRTINGVEEREALVALDRLFFVQMRYWKSQETGGFALALQCQGDLLGSTVAFEK